MLAFHASSYLLMPPVPCCNASRENAVSWRGWGVCKGPGDGRANDGGGTWKDVAGARGRATTAAVHGTLDLSSVDDVAEEEQQKRRRAGLTAQLDPLYVSFLFMVRLAPFRYNNFNHPLTTIISFLN